VAGIRSVRRLLVVATALSLMGALSAVARPDVAAAAPTGYVAMSDGVSIAVNVRMPANFVPGQRYPTVFEMSGYDGGSADGGTLAKDVGVPPGTPVVPRDDSRQLSDLFNGEYVTVHASVRGTGCSSGEYDLFSWRSALDGKEIIDNWIPEQPWSNGAVGILGHSYGGITGFMVAATQPQHLKAVTVSGLIDDLYRGIVYPGGVSNYGFPLLWTGGIRTAYDVGGGLLPGLVRPQRPEDSPNRQEQCATNTAGKSRTVTNDAILQGLADTDNDWYRSRSLITYVDKIKVPIHIVGAYQDEQTGPRGQAHLFERIGGVPKRLMLTNGDHNTESTADYGVPDIRNDRKAWLDQWVRGVNAGFGNLKQARSSVSVLFETHRDEADALVPNGRKDARTFPLPDTRWTDWYLHGDGTLTPNSPAAPEPAQQYVTGTKRQSWSYQAGGEAGPPVTTAEGPDELTYRSEPVATDTAIAGPITATLFVQSTAPDTELFVQLVDEGPDGSRTYLQRGVLRASHRAVDDSQSQHTPDGRIYRPHRPHTNPTNITPTQTYEYLVEVWPVGHVFRAGHRISVKVHTPPFVDSFYAYVPRSAPGVNTVLQTPDTPSRIMLPMVPLTGVQLGPPLACGAQEAVRCVAQPG
jgi:putative CocE/NonD family hydrolase